MRDRHAAAHVPDRRANVGRPSASRTWTSTAPARMVDVGGKAVTHRRAVAGATITMQPRDARDDRRGPRPKGDVFAVARVAGIMAAKRTSDLIPLCHPLALTHAAVDLGARGRRRAITRRRDGRQDGVEMEALTAAASPRSPCTTCARPSTAAWSSTGWAALSKGRAAGPAPGPAKRTTRDAMTDHPLPSRDRRLGEPEPAQDDAQDARRAGARSCSTAASRATRTPATGTARCRCSRWSRSTRWWRQGLDVGPGDFAENITTRASTCSRCRSAASSAWATAPCSRSARSARSATRSARSTTRPATASCPRGHVRRRARRRGPGRRRDRGRLARRRHLRPHAGRGDRRVRGREGRRGRGRGQACAPARRASARRRSERPWVERCASGS